MFEYAAVLQTDFRELFVNGVNDFINWLANLAFYWYVLAIVLFIVLVRLLSGKKS